MIKLLLVAGARPNFMKIAPVLREIERRPDNVRQCLVHTGQHYDEGMSEVFFRELGIPSPDFHLEVGSGSHAVQSARIMTAFEPVLLDQNPDCVVVVGDVNSTLACTVVAKKLGFRVAHVEAGLRSRDMTMPEEINRIVTDSICDFFFVTERSGLENLVAEGHARETIHFVGHVMIDNLYYELDKLRESDRNDFPTAALKAQCGRYGVVTLHRPANVDRREILTGIFAALTEISRELPLVFPVHPRTALKIREFGLSAPDGLHLIQPLGYREFLNLWSDARLVLTDSGGLQEETTALGVPCLTLRSNTERPITVHAGTNRLVGADPDRIVAAAREALQQSRKTASRPELWDGQASGRILDALVKGLS